MFGRIKSELPTPQTALPGRDDLMPLPPAHFVHGRRLQAPFPATCEQLLVGMGCFWGAERMFWQLPGVYWGDLLLALGLGVLHYFEVRGYYASALHVSSAPGHLPP